MKKNLEIYQKTFYNNNYTLVYNYRKYSCRMNGQIKG